MNNRYFIVCDFDGTLANTFESSPNGMNVSRATDNAVRDVFGDDGYDAYEQIGGMSNREPGELVQLIQKQMGFGVFEDATEQFVEQKLSYLLPEITPEWPKLYPGFREFFQRASELSIDIGIISSGHDSFIRKAFEVHGITPDILVTSDIIRSRRMPQRPRYKPNPYQFAEGHLQWLKKSVDGDPLAPENREIVIRGAQDKQRIVYIGDDPVKDGGLAERVGIPFIFVPFTKPEFTPVAEAGQVLALDFFAICDTINNHAEDLREGKSFAQIFLEEGRNLPPQSVEGQQHMMVSRERGL